MLLVAARCCERDLTISGMEVVCSDNDDGCAGRSAAERSSVCFV
jgi:hypothetical protein